MDNELSPEQKEQLTTWAGQRDALLTEISNLRVERDKLSNDNKFLAVSYTDMENRMLEIRGRIEELKIKEAEMPERISKDVAYLESKKTSLEVEVASLTKLIDVLTPQKANLELDIASALSVFDAVKDESMQLEKIVDHVTRVSENNTTKIDALVAKLATSLEDIIEVNRKNVFETNIVIDKVPRMLMELQKHGLIKNKT